jgi:hypothetical protein
VNNEPISKGDLDSFKVALEKDLQSFVIARENSILKWVVAVQLAFFAIQVTTLLGTAGLILGGVYYILTHYTK